MANARINLGNALLFSGKTEESIRYLQDALRIGPESAKAHCGLAVALERLGTTDRAIEHYRRTLRLQPDHAQAREALDRLTQNP